MSLVKIVPCNICGQLPLMKPGSYRNFGTFSEWVYPVEHLCTDGQFTYADSNTQDEIIERWNEANPIVIKKGTQLSLF